MVFQACPITLPEHRYRNQRQSAWTGDLYEIAKEAGSETKTANLFCAFFHPTKGHKHSAYLVWESPAQGMLHWHDPGWSLWLSKTVQILGYLPARTEPELCRVFGSEPKVKPLYDRSIRALALTSKNLVLEQSQKQSGKRQKFQFSFACWFLQKCWIYFERLQDDST